MNDDQQKLTDEVVDLVMKRVLIKIAPNLTKEDMVKIEDLNQQDLSGEATCSYLESRVPNFDQLLQQETELLKTELTST